MASFGAPTAFMHPFPIWCTHIYAPPPHLVRPHLCTPSPFKVHIALLHPLPIQCGTRTCAPSSHSVRHPHLCTPSPFSAPTALVHPLPIQCGTHTCAPPPHSVRHPHLCTPSPFSAQTFNSLCRIPIRHFFFLIATTSNKNF